LPGTGKTNQETISWPKSALYAGSFAKLVGLFIDGLSWSLLVSLPRPRGCMTYPAAPGVHLNLTDFSVVSFSYIFLPRKIEPASDYSPRLSLAAPGQLWKSRSISQVDISATHKQSSLHVGIHRITDRDLERRSPSKANCRPRATCVVSKGTEAGSDCDYFRTRNDMVSQTSIRWRGSRCFGRSRRSGSSPLICHASPSSHGRTQDGTEAKKAVGGFAFRMRSASPADLLGEGGNTST